MMADCVDADGADADGADFFSAAYAESCPRSMAKIFISYRREDSAYATGVIRDQLVGNLAGCEVFFDVDSIPFGVDFRQHLENSVGACDFLVAVIGKTWLTVVDAQGQRRLDNPNDAVRVEVETALARNIPLIPVFLDSPVPTPEQLPDSLRDLVGRNGVFVRPPPDFKHDVAKLVHALQQWLEQQSGRRRDHRPPATERRASKCRRCSSRAGRRAAQAVAADAAAPAPVSGRRLPGLAGRPARLDAWCWRRCWSVRRPEAGGWLRPADGLPEFEILETYLFEDGDPMPAPWQAHSRMLNGGFKCRSSTFTGWWWWGTPKTFGRLTFRLECRLLDSDGEVVKFTGLTAELPDATYPGRARANGCLRSARASRFGSRANTRCRWARRHEPPTRRSRWLRVEGWRPGAVGGLPRGNTACRQAKRCRESSSGDRIRTCDTRLMKPLL